ncbi:MAG: serine kinase [Pseudomonadota bacterium]
MKLAELKDRLNLEILTGVEGLNRDVCGGYVGDLLSDVMANSESGQVWITIQGHINIIAVATLRDLAAVILAGGRAPNPDTLARARESGLPLLRGELSSFELCGRLHRLFFPEG